MSFELTPNQDELNERRHRIESEINEFEKIITAQFSAAEVLKIKAALDFMLKIHLPQDDRVDGRPFASHPLAVAEKVMSLSNNPDLVIAALIHDSVEDQSDYIFVERLNRKYPNRDFLPLKIDDTVKEKYKSIFTTWSFKEIADRFGSKIRYYVENMTNHDFNSLAESLGLEGSAKQDFVNKLYAEHVETIINDPDLFTLKLADLSVNIDLHSLSPDSDKYRKLKRKYKSVIEAFLEKLKNLPADQPLYSQKNEIMTELNDIYLNQYHD
jgi:(p)ppGpp synthase/HD superfamily hydrolase